jgi:hypothetical protein
LGGSHPPARVRREVGLIEEVEGYPGLVVDGPHMTKASSRFTNWKVAPPMRPADPPRPKIDPSSTVEPKYSGWITWSFGRERHQSA